MFVCLPLITAGKTKQLEQQLQRYCVHQSGYERSPPAKADDEDASFTSPVTYLQIFIVVIYILETYSNK